MKQGIKTSVLAFGVLVWAGQLQAEETPSIDMSGLLDVGEALEAPAGAKFDYQSEIKLITDVAGFQSGLSTTPNFIVDRPVTSNLTEGWSDNPIEFGLTYAGSFTDTFNVGASVSYLSAEGDGEIDPQSWAVDASLGFHGFLLSGSYRDGEGERGLLDRGYEAWNFQGGYEVGPWGFAVSYAEDEYDFAVQTSESAAYQAGVDYVLPSGVVVGGGVQQIEFDGDIDTGLEDEATVIYMETMISF